MLRTIAFVFVLLSVATCSAHDADAPDQRDRLGETDFTQALSGLETRQSAWTIDAAQPGASRRVSAPGSAVWDLRAFDSIAITAACEGRGIALLHLRWRITSKSGGLYELETPVKLTAQAPAVVALPLNLHSDAGTLIPVGHRRPWDGLAASDVVALEFLADWRGPYTAGAVSLKLNQLTLQPRSPQPHSAILTGVALNPAPATSRARGVLSFRIEPEPPDPFAVSGEGDVRVIQPDGRERLAFLDQSISYVNDGSATRTIPVGRPLWRAYVDLDPAMSSFQIKSGERTWAIKNLHPSESPAPLPAVGEGLGEGSRGLRWSPDLEIALPVSRKTAGDSAWRLENGAWVPASPENAPRAWRPVPFWNAAWGQFDGAARANFEEAARLDALLAHAAENGRGLPLVLLPGEILDSSGTFNWQSHPLNGVLPTRSSTLTEPAGMEFYARWMRYTLARWESSLAVRELRITTALNSPDTPAFQRRVAAILKALPRDEKVPVLSQDPLTLPLDELGSIEPFSSADGNPLACWHADYRFGPSVLSIQPPAAAQVEKGEQGGIAAALSRDPLSRTLGIAGDYQFGPPPLLVAADGLMFDVFLPPEQPPDLRAGLHLSTDEDWFDVVFPEMLRPGEWNRFILDLTRANSNGLRGLKSGKPWSGEQRARVFELGIHLFSTHAGWSVKSRPQPLAMQLKPLRAIRFPRGGAGFQPAISTIAVWNPQTVQSFHVADSPNADAPSGWRPAGGLARSVGSVVDRAAPGNAACFEVRASDAGATAIGATGRFLLGTPGDLSNADTLLFDLWVPPAAPADLRAGVHLIDENGDWLHTVLLPSPTPGAWMTCALDLSPANAHHLVRVPRAIGDSGANGESGTGQNSGEVAAGIVAHRRFFEIGVELYSTHPNWSTKDSGFLPSSMRVANVRAARVKPGKEISGETAAGANDLLSGEPRRIESLSDAANAPFAWLVDSHLGSPARGTDTRSDNMHEFSIQSNFVNATSICVLGKSSDRSLNRWNQPAHDDLYVSDALMFQVWIPAETQPGARVGVHLRNRDAQWFEALLPNPLIPEQWNTCAIDLTANNVHKLKGLGHDAVWNDYSRQRLREIGIHVYATPAGKGQPLSVRIRDVRSVAFGPIGNGRRPEKLAIELFDPVAQKPVAAAANSANINRGELWECHFTINKTFANPFDPRECEAFAEIATPSGKTVNVPAFFNQLCRRREADAVANLTPNPSPLTGKGIGGEEIVEAYGPEFFTVRYRPLESGPHAVTLKLRENGAYQERKDAANRLKFVPGAISASLALGAKAFVAVDPPKGGGRPFHGFVRCAADQRHLQFDDGSFFYPIGPCLRSPSDTRIPYADPKWNMNDIARIGRRGTYQYDEYFKAAAENGCNWARVWMCSWWGSLEWRRDWPGYQGAGRYNLLNAWRIDYLLGLAERLGLTVNLCLTNHGQFSPEVDTEWANNPYGVTYGGPLNAPREFFTSVDARILHQNKLRYVVARYGHSPAVMAWSLFSEVEFTQEYAEGRGKNVAAWHAEMAAYLKEIDPNHHLVATHFSHPKNGADTLSVPQIDIAASNAYSVFEELSHAKDAAEALASFWSGNERFRGFMHFKKPALVEEQGRHFMGGHENTPQTLEADLHCGLWGSMVQPLAGATGYWWWLQLHYDKKWDAYKPLAAFMKNEDFRAGKNERTLEPSELDTGNTLLHARALSSQERAYVWVYQKSLPQAGAMEPVAGAELTLPSLRAGSYDVEFWNTETGAIVERAVVDSAAKLKLPVIERDIAIKIKAKH